MAVGDISVWIGSNNNAFYKRLRGASVKRTTRLNGDDLIEITVKPHPANFIILSQVTVLWKIDVIMETQYDSVTHTYDIYDYKDNMGFGNSEVVIIGVRDYIHDLKRNVVYQEANGSMTFRNRVNLALEGSGYAVNWGDTNPTDQRATVMENFGYSSSWEMLTRTMTYYGIDMTVEFTTVRKVVYLHQKYGDKLGDYVRYSVNLKELIRSREFGNFATFGRGFGAFKDPDDPTKGRYEASYTSDLVSVYGKHDLNPPVVDERFTSISNLQDEIKRRIGLSLVDSTSVEMNALKISREASIKIKNGDFILLVDSGSNVREDVRIVQTDVTYNEYGEMLQTYFTIGDYSKEFNRMKTKLELEKGGKY